MRTRLFIKQLVSYFFIILFMIWMSKLPFNEWMAMSNDEIGNYIQSVHTKFYLQHPMCAVISVEGYPRKDYSMIDFWAKCVRWKEHKKEQQPSIIINQNN